MTAGKSDEETHKNELPDRGKALPAKRAGSEEDMAAAILVCCAKNALEANLSVPRELRRLLVSGRLRL